MKLVEFHCVCYDCVIACMGRNISSLVSFYLLLIYAKPKQMSHQSPNVDEKTMTDQLLEAYNLLSQLTNQNQEDTKNIPAPPPFQVDRLIKFLKLRPKKFSQATEPILADDWLRSVTKDLVIIECTDAEKVRFTAHLLEGPAASWWYSYQITSPH